MALFRAKRLRAIVGRERYAGRPSQLPRLDPPREKPETTEGEAGSLIGFPSKERYIGRD